jgi:hypothetical protein
MRIGKALFIATASMVLVTAAGDPSDTAGREASQKDPSAAATSKKPDITNVKFGSITINGKVFFKDVVFENGKVRMRNKGPSRPLRSKFGHTPLTPLEEIPWKCKTLVIGTGMHGRLPVVKEFKEEAERRGVTLILLKTPKAVKYFLDNYGPDINAIFHITC